MTISVDAAHGLPVILQHAGLCPDCFMSICSPLKALYGAGVGSNLSGAGLKLSKPLPGLA
jgi:hypothetical protein